MSIWPVLIWVALVAMDLAITIAKHGEPRPAYDAWVFIIVVLPTSTGLLWWGGFFAPLFR